MKISTTKNIKKNITSKNDSNMRSDISFQKQQYH